MLGLGIFFCGGCGKSRVPAITFYFWQSDWSPESTSGLWENFPLQAPLHLRFFDLDWDPSREEVILRGPLQVQATLPDEFIPVVFITNRTFVHLPADRMDAVVELTLSQLQKMGWEGKGEIQFDCDWTVETRENFFSFLSRFRAMAGPEVVLSATIRLHQVKFPEKTGIPPVDRGTLMFYNMGNLQEADEPNSILNLQIGEDYLAKLPDYPMSLDIALPIFGWAVVRRYEKVVALLPEVTPEHLREDSLIEFSEGNYAKVAKSHYFRENYLYKGDEIRLEGASIERLKEAAALLRRFAPETGFRNLVFYHISQVTSHKISYHELEEIRDRFH